MMIDGIVNDLKQKGFFTSGVDISAWNSIAAHDSGLNSIKQIFDKTRKRTTEQKITIPYRHGILHGRDLGYANKYVAAKVWGTLYAIRDWVIANNKKEPAALEAKPIKPQKEEIQELLDVINEYQKNRERNEII